MNTVSQALVEHEPTQAPVAPPLPVSEAAAVLQIIDRAARDPLVDIDKMKQLMEMRNRMKAEQAELEFDAAMSDAQEAMQPVRADANNPSTKSKYASFAALDSAIRPIYTKHGFAVTFDTADSPLDGHIRVVAKVSRGGHRERPHIDMPADGKGAKGGDVMTKTHAVGSAVSYGKRYLLGMTFNIAVKDDDGNAAGARPSSGPITEAQLIALRELIDVSGADIEICCEKWGIEALPEMRADRYEANFNTLKRWHEGQQKQGGAR